jgi:Sec-independent protein translocase protein TatA
LRSDKPLELFYSFSLEESSKPDETEREFRIRIQHLAHEKRDLEMEEMKIKYESKIRKLEERKRNAEQTLEQKSSLAKQRKIEAAVSTGVAIFGALFGTKTLTKTSVSKVGTAMRSANKAMQSGTSIEQAEEDIKAVENQILLVQQELERELETLAQKYNIMEEELQKITISPTYSNIIVHLVGLAWKPVAKF